MTLPRRILILLAVSLTLGVVANLASPRRIPWAQDWSNYVQQAASGTGMKVVDLETTRSIAASGSHILLDARPLRDYDRGHIPGALPVPFQEVETAFAQVQMLLSPAQPILVYCSGEECDESLLLGKFLIEQGFTNIVLFAGGYGEWSKGEAR